MSYLPELFDSKDYATTIKVLDSMAGDIEGPALASLLCNRALCYQKMDLHRKALKNYEEAIKAHPTFARAHMGKGKALQALGRTQEAQAAWRKSIEGFSPADDLQMVEDAYTYVRDPAVCLRRGAVQEPAAAAHSSIQVQQPRPVQVANGSAARPPVPQPAQNALSRTRQGMPDTSMAVALAVSHINNGRVDDALQLLDDVIQNSQAPNMGALVARGTARALKRDLDGAIEDFTGSIALYANYGDAWKRRGQAKSANGDKEGAIEDFQRALELITDTPGRAEILAECAAIYQKERDLRRAVKELEASVRLNARNASAWNHLGLCCTGLGDIEAGCSAYKKAIALEPKNLEAWFNMAQARKEAAHVDEAEKAFRMVFKLLKPGSRGAQMRRVYAHMKQGMGAHTEAIAVLTEALEEGAEGASKVECCFLRGACNHALGFHKQAIEDYSKAFLIHEDGLPEETRQHQVLAFFQRELALHAHSHLDDPVASFSLDREIHPLFKELWCKKAPPSQSQLPACQLRHLPPPSESSSDSLPPLPDAASSARLCKAADAIGELLQNRHQGFLENKRQQRMGGLAAIELAQKVRQLLEARQAGKRMSVSKGATGDAQSHAFGWRDAMDIVVKWRQLSEPNDQVLWVDLLTKSEFEAGFGSHTPIFSGQTKCVRYYMNFHRALGLLKEILLKEGKAFDASSRPIPLGSDAKQEAIRKAESAGDMWTAIGEDSWAVVPIESQLHPAESLEGTRLTVVKIVSQPNAYEMSIRTPVTPPRWRQFDEELSALWEELLVALEGGDKRLMAVAALTYVYYWYNFMPLARGTAVSGYITLLALFLVADMPIQQKIPQDYQVDWEAILQRSPVAFITSLSSWLLPPEVRTPSGGEAAVGAQEADRRSEAAAEVSASDSPSAQSVKRLTQRLVSSDVFESSSGEASEEASGNSSDMQNVPEGMRLAELPAVAELIPTLRNRLEFLNGPELPRL